MRTRDWRHADDEVVAALYAREIARWGDELSWDTATTTWPVVEQGRRQGTVLGVIAGDGDAVEGWCFGLVHDRTLQVGGFVSTTGTATRALAAHLASAARDAGACDSVWFGFFDAPGLQDLLAAANAAPSRYSIRAPRSTRLAPASRSPGTDGDAAGSPVGDRRHAGGAGAAGVSLRARHGVAPVCVVRPPRRVARVCGSSSAPRAAGSSIPR
ncbi:MAG: hypothetical protein R2712_05125 [Vicinamibacterales bacterium]